MIPGPPPGQGPIDPRGAFSPPPAPTGAPQPSQSYGSPPPPMMYPPPMPMMPPPMYYPPPPKQGGSFARAIFMTLATTVFGLSLALNAYLLLAAGVAGSSGRVDRQTLRAGDAQQRVAVIPLTGLIDQQSRRRFERLLAAAEADSSVKALVIEIDTPGGEITASDEIYQRILRAKQTRMGMPVVIAMGSMATSGGYYVSCAGDEIYAQPTTLTGNIGVVLFRMNFAGMLEKWGIKETSITPEGSTFKNAESMFKPETPEATAYLRGIADEMYGRFKSIVEKSRGSVLTAPMNEVASGKVFTADEALKMKLVDQVGYTLDAAQAAAKRANLSNPTVVRFEPPTTLLSALSGEASFAGLVHRDDGAARVNISLDTSLLTEMSRPRLMYLWQTP